MTDLNSKPYTIQMIQNDTTLGKEEGSRETSSSESCAADNFRRDDPIPSVSLQCPLPRAACVPHLPGELSLRWGPRGCGTDIMMPCYRLGTKRGFLKGTRPRSLFLSHTLQALKENPAVSSLHQQLGGGPLACCVQAQRVSPWAARFVLRYSQPLLSQNSHLKIGSHSFLKFLSVPT